ncbi:MAG: purine-nucleoside phosphorylase [Blastocatellia bacterium]|nr:purine-nucleoside phosphorylase [Blastocatellia bacterium]MCS7157361.1 purine-nucleoside phosphorylase [Blastocatellia bacterium]MCX7753227.1 purine-nucleoside phosphorylase [Blastocatellia bacterium]MDW8168266.1 purine-nucleoside phosphorylase [Acidobacteriota bacterium]MDW8255441.1 purine-nucleoside phosphorylase [Acidobacteriota bacterium]
MAKSLYERVQEAVAFIRERSAIRPQVGLVLGSGLGTVVGGMSDAVELNYAEIPHFPTATVAGHPGRLLLGRLATTAVAVLQGRFHYYEGYAMEDVTFPIRVLGVLGVRQVVLTNAAGGINLRFRPGSLMLIADHLNLMGVNPLRGPNDERFGPRFPDLTQVYSPLLRALAHDVAREIGLALEEGVYAAVSGPSYETPAEIRMLRQLGADAVGMSTVPEAIVARHMGMEVLGLSVIANMAAGIAEHPLRHEDVLEAMTRVRERLQALLDRLIPRLAEAHVAQTESRPKE